MRHAASDLRPLFRWLGRDDLADAIGLAGIRRTHAIAGPLPDDEHRRLLEACASRSVPSSVCVQLVVAGLVTMIFRV